MMSKKDKMRNNYSYRVCDITQNLNEHRTSRGVGGGGPGRNRVQITCNTSSA